MTAVLVALGGALGALARYGINTVMVASTASRFPWATLTVNVTGSFLLGAVLRSVESSANAGAWRALLAIGFCGAYTTFSTFSYESVRLMQERHWLAAGTSMLSNVLLCIIAVIAGFAVVNRLS
jgi:fluoride exporter